MFSPISQRMTADLFMPDSSRSGEKAIAGKAFRRTSDAAVVSGVAFLYDTSLRRSRIRQELPSSAWRFAATDSSHVRWKVKSLPQDSRRPGELKWMRWKRFGPGGAFANTRTGRFPRTWSISFGGCRQRAARRNGQPWQFIVVDQRSLLDEVARINPNAHMAAHAPLGILICGDLSLERSPGYWVVDCSAATPEHAFGRPRPGIGRGLDGIYPRPERMEGFRNLFALPEGVIVTASSCWAFPQRSSRRSIASAPIVCGETAGDQRRWSTLPWPTAAGRSCW